MAKLVTSSVKLVGEEVGQFIGIKHDPGELVSALRSLIADKLGMHASSIQLFQISVDEVEKLESGEVTDSAVIIGKETLASYVTLSENTWLLATGRRKVESVSSGDRASITSVESLLVRSGIRQPEGAVIRRAALRYGHLLTFAQNNDRADLAKEAYEMAASLPSLTTELHLLSASGIKLNGPLHEGSALSICFQGVRVLVLKPLDRTEHQRVSLFSQSLPDGLTIAGITPFSLHVSREGSNKHYITMPRYMTSVEPLIFFEMPEVIKKFWCQMRDAVKGLHALGFAHMDIKPANICITAGGDFMLVDLGSIVRFGERSASTPAYLPRHFGQMLACPSVDWWMLAMSLAEKGCSNSGMSIGSGARSASKEDLCAHLERHLPSVVWDELRAVLD